MISAVLAIVIVNTAYRLFLKIFDIKVAFVDVKKKLAWYIIVGAIIFAIIHV